MPDPRVCGSARRNGLGVPETESPKMFVGNKSPLALLLILSLGATVLASAFLFLRCLRNSF